jgi:hypothetical protein
MVRKMEAACRRTLRTIQTATPPSGRTPLYFKPAPRALKYKKPTLYAQPLSNNNVHAEQNAAVPDINPPPHLVTVTYCPGHA